MRSQRLTAKDHYILTRWMDDNTPCGTLSEIAELATKELELGVTQAHIADAARTIGMEIKSTKKPTDILANNLIKVLKELGMPVDEELQRIAHKKAP